MAASLEDLLAEDGFKGRKSLTRSRTSFRSEKSPSYHVQVKKDFIRTQRTRSDVARYSRNGESPRTEPRDNLVRREKKEIGRFGARKSNTSHEENEIFEVVGDEENERVKDIFSDEASKSQPKKLTSDQQPALDEIAIQAMVSILTGYIKRFLKEKEFRATIRASCFSTLDFLESRVMATLEEAIDGVEKCVEQSSMSIKDMKKAVLQLSVLMKMNSNDDQKNVLSACAHLYLGVIYKFQNKDRVAAKHLLQVFCDSPSQARKMLLPELWDCLFSPHLSHLKIWYNEEASSLLDTQEKSRKMKVLDKVYDEIVDSGTYQFAIYYKDWLTEGVETTPVPCVLAPSVAIGETRKGDSSELSSGSSDPFSPQPMVSKALYNAMFGRTSKFASEDRKEIESSEDSPVVKHTLTIEEVIEAAEEDNGLIITSKENWNVLEEKDSTENEKFVNSVTCQEISENTKNTEENELTLKRLAKSVFELQQPENTSDFTTPTLTNLTKVKQASQELHEDDFEDFICPLTRKIFEDPVSIETGYTFEQKAIKAWFDQGNKTCPITGKVLECKLIPSTNLILKKVIKSWKSQHCRQLLAMASQVIENSGTEEESEATIFILEQLLTDFGQEERTNNVKHLISLGGLKFLLQQFECGNLETKTRLVGLLLCCIEADSGCRNQIARDISKKCLLELLHSKLIKARTRAVLLIIELICLKRKRDIIEFLSGLQNENEGLEDTMHIILVYLEISPPHQKPLVGVLLLYLDLLVEPRKYSIYREEAVDAITEALDQSLSDEKVRESCCRALLMLGGQFSSSGKLLTETWILNQARYFKGNPLENDEDSSFVDDAYSLEEDEQKNEEWLRKLSTSLLGNGKKSFVEGISKCVGSKNLEELVGVCLTTVAWLSFSLSSISDSELQISAFSVLISRLKETLENGLKIEHKILASTTLLSFTKISECRVLLMSMAENITAPLPSLAEETWTAKMLYAIISGHEL